MKYIVSRIDGYSFIEVIGEGAQGIVCRARGPEDDVALKVCRHGILAGQVQRRRFRREADTHARLNHPRIVRLLDSGTTGGYLWLATEFVDGMPLDRWQQEEADLLREDMTWDLAVFRKICEAVAFAHDKGVAHLDLNPRNVLVDSDNEPHVLDFGLAKELQQSRSPHTLVDSRGGGTLPYLAPEQLTGNKCDHRADIYALGVILYTWVTMTIPFDVTTDAEAVRAIIGTSPVPPSRRFRRLQPGVERLILKCMAKAPADRYPSVAELLEDLDRAEADGGAASSRSSTLRRTCCAVAAASLLITLLVTLPGPWWGTSAGQAAARPRSPRPNLGTAFFVGRDLEIDAFIELTLINRYRVDEWLNPPYGRVARGVEVVSHADRLRDYTLEQLAHDHEEAARAMRAWRLLTTDLAVQCGNKIAGGIAEGQVAMLDRLRRQADLDGLPASFLAEVEPFVREQQAEACIDWRREQAMQDLRAASRDGVVLPSVLTQRLGMPRGWESSLERRLPLNEMLSAVEDYYGELETAARSGRPFPGPEFFDGLDWSPAGQALVEGAPEDAARLLQLRRDWATVLGEYDFDRSTIVTRDSEHG